MPKSKKNKAISLPTAMRIVQNGGVILPTAEHDLRRRLRAKRKRLGELFKRSQVDAKAIELVSKEIARLEAVLAMNQSHKEKVG